MPINPRLAIVLTGPFADGPTNSTNMLLMYVQLLQFVVGGGPYNSDPSEWYNSSGGSIATNVTQAQHVLLVNDAEFDTAPQIRKTFYFDLGATDSTAVHSNQSMFRIRMRSSLNVGADVPIRFAYDPSPLDKSMGIIYAAILLLGLYVLIIWEIVHRTFAAIIASTSAIAILAIMNERPTMPEIMSWIDVETLLLLFGMMILVAILSETGIFDYLAVYAYKVRYFLIYFANQFHLRRLCILILYICKPNSCFF